MNKIKSIVAIIISWLILFAIIIAWGVIFPQKDTLTLLATGYALMPFVSIIVFAVNMIIYRKTISRNKWFCIIMLLVLLIWAIIFFKAFFIVCDGAHWNVRWIR